MAKKKAKISYIPAFLTLSIALSVLFFIGYKSSIDNDSLASQSGTNLTFQTEENGKEFKYDVKKLMHNTEVTVPGTKQIVSLVDGKADFSEDGGSGTIQMGDTFSVVDLGKNDFNVFGVVTVNYGGSGDFVYVVLYYADAQLFQNTDFSNVGDRVIMESLQANSKKNKNGSYTLNVNYLDRGPTAPMSDTPTIKKTLPLEVKDNKFTND